MNLSDFERQLRADSEPQYFPPEEDRWAKLEQDLDRKRTRRIAFLPRRISWSAAAALALLIGVGLYHLRTPQHVLVPNVAIDRPAGDQPAAPPIPQTQDTVATPAGTAPASRSLNRPFVATAPQKPVPPCNPVPPGYQHPGPDSTVIARTPEQPKPPVPVRSPGAQPVPRKDAPLFDDGGDYAATPKNKVDFGCAAFYGFAGGNAGANYRLSLQARKSISGRVFASVQLVGSAGRLSSSSTYQYQTVSLTPSSLTPITSTEEVEAVYSGNIYTVGLSPAIGVRITKHLSLSTGPDFQKVLTPAIALTNRDDFRNQINNQSLVADSKPVSGLDVGLQSAVSVDVSRRIGCSLLYRHGFTDYLQKSNGSSRNSFLSIGLSYSFR